MTLTFDLLQWITLIAAAGFAGAAWVMERRLVRINEKIKAIRLELDAELRRRTR